MILSNSSYNRLNLNEFLCFVIHIIISLTRNIVFDSFEYMNLNILNLSGFDIILRIIKFFGNNYYIILDNIIDHLQSIIFIIIISSMKDLIFISIIDSIFININNSFINIINPNSS